MITGIRARDLRLVPVAGIVWAVALLCVFLPGAVWWCAVGGGLLGATALGMLVRAHMRGAIRARGGLLAVIALAAAAAAMTVGFEMAQRASAAELDGRVVDIYAEISSSSATGSDGRLWFDAQTSHAGIPNRPEPLHVPIRIGVERVPGLDLGTAIRVTGQVIATDPGERAALVVFGTDVEIVMPAQGVFAVAAQVREDFVDRATRLPEPGAGLLPGLAVGDTRAVTPELNAAMLTSGLSHLTAVSGANCAIVVGAVFWLVALCGGGRTLRVAIALTALAAFVVLVTPEPSVIRAAVMAAVAMLTVLCGRPSAGLGVLCLAVAGILIADPWLSATPGFALSAAATAALIVLAPPLARGLARWMPQPLALAIAIPLAAQLVCGPIIALFSEQQSIIAIVANMIAAPAAPIATVIGLLACLAAPIPPVADLLAACAWLPSAWISTTATVSAGLPGAQVAVVPGIPAALLVAVLSASIGVVLSVDGIAARRGVRGFSVVVLVVALGLAGARMLLTGPLVGTTVPEAWSIAACDVGQGDALLVRSEQQVALIDTGMEAEPLSTCLNALGIGRIDLLVLTHFDADHVGAAASVVGRVGTVLHGPVGSPEDAQLLSELNEGGAELVEVSTGMHGALGAASWKVLWPRKESAAFPAGNDASVVLEFDGGEVPRSLFLGDLSATPQRMLRDQLRGTYAVVKVAHHGSADQDTGLYDLLRPAAAIFSAGVDNDYGHPRAETLALLDAAGAVVLRTDQQGRILIGRDGEELVLWAERAAASAEPTEAADDPLDVDDPR
ncbi:ComEC/Rec2 family competence protein [Microbacterium sp.]|uniref:ComEC/Rec2 family competence protein n=1 Tax=Microbacterium sp. TaxID=51671 RepID=UPI0027368423|nr:ComEC/Rec2 family competence protein [Microbacterium sp.]MDP3951635.1 ComEC/Rec2 family competence protein [Microbacterium sp.]